MLLQSNNIFIEMYMADYDAFVVPSQGYNGGTNYHIWPYGLIGIFAKYFPGLQQFIRKNLKDMQPIIVATSKLGREIEDIDRYLPPYLIICPDRKFLRDKADPAVILEAFHSLGGLATAHKLDTIILPPIGVGCGNLSWIDIQPVHEKTLDDRFTVALGVQPQVSPMSVEC